MVNRLVIQLLKEYLDGNGNTLREFRWGDISDAESWSSATQCGDGDALLAAVISQPILLLIPGHQVVSFSVPYNKNEARHFLDLLPYQIEDDVLGNGENLHFAVSNHKEYDTVCAAYTDMTWLASLVNWLSGNGLIVESCIADFQCLDATSNELVLWFNEGYVLGHRGNGLGFSVAYSLAKPFLKDLLQNQQSVKDPWLISVYVNDVAELKNIQENILPVNDYNCIAGAPSLNLQQTNQFDFSRGKLGKKLPISKWWGEAKALTGLAAAAITVFFVVSFVDIYLLKKEHAKIQNEIVNNFRQVVPNGSVSVPIRRLKAMLRSDEQDKKASQAIYLLSKIAPSLTKLNVGLTTLSYSNREQVFRINIKVDSFSVVEQLRQTLEKQDVIGELQSSNAIDNGFQARLKISLRGRNNG
jgi:type II secretion system protein L